MLRFIHNITHSNQSKSGELSIAETETSEKLWIHSEQNIIKIKKNYANLRKQLGLFTEDGILKLKGRFGNSNLKHEFKHPILIDSDSYFTRLVVLDAHENVKHLRTNSTLNEIRSKYWIRKGRQVVNRIIRPCVLCIPIHRKLLKGPPTPDLPTYIIAAEFAFTKIGLDHAGPLLVNAIYDGGTMHKAYICLFTCASTRNVHLELTPNLGIEALIRCLKRFMARRCVMELVISDNFKTFISEDVKAFLSKEDKMEFYIA